MFARLFSAPPEIDGPHFRPRYALTFAKTAFIQSRRTNFPPSTRHETEKGREGDNCLRQCSRRNNRWLLNRKRTRVFYGVDVIGAKMPALRKRTTCLVSSVSFVSRFLPMNKPGLHPPAAARHPSSKHKAPLPRRLARRRKARRYSFAMSLQLFLLPSRVDVLVPRSLICT